MEMIRTAYLCSSELIEPSPSSWFKPLSYPPHMRPRMGRCGTKTAQDGILKTKKTKVRTNGPILVPKAWQATWALGTKTHTPDFSALAMSWKNLDFTSAGLLVFHQTFLFSLCCSVPGTEQHWYK